MASAWTLEPELGRELLESMLLARHLDLCAHELRAKNHGHYTISSTGHESNVILGRLTRPSDPSLLHYRSAALVLERARKRPERDTVLDIALSLVASAEEPSSGGRHKVFGSRALGIIPKTSTIASHLPRAVGLAFALELRPRLGLQTELPEDAVVMASFGDASVNHSTALGAFNAAGWTAYQNLKLPLLFVCEDNGLGISVRSPPGWIEERLRALPHVRYFQADGRELQTAFDTAGQALAYCRRSRRPAILHLRCVRLLGHAGSDVDATYRSPAEIEQAMAEDPLPLFADSLLAGRVMSIEQILALDEAAGERAQKAAMQVVSRPKLTTREQVMSAIALAVEPGNERVPAVSSQSGDVPRLTLAQGINQALAAILQEQQGALVFGEDVAKKGGVYGISKGLLERFGAARVFNTLLDEQTILGLALGAATLGLLPIPEIQYLAYLHNAEDQLRGEASTMRFFSAGAFDNPLILRLPGLAYQKGFGGHFHNDHSLAVLRDLPGVVVGVPARADDADAMFKAALELALGRRRVVVLVEPIALYHRRDLYTDGDGGWLSSADGRSAAVGRARVYRAEAAELLIVTYGNGLWLSLRAARTLERTAGRAVRVLDLRWVSPLPEADILAHAEQTGRVLVVDECRRSGNVGEAVLSALALAGFAGPVARVASADSFVP
ncbi:MAG TPA: thiamine pyrophosphate-dependent enzyme, partial [Polyangiaceae bacterium]|nr:thiamine pyrophosphate-dependent enzyme [Polyangiaceae bacterium]